MSRKLKEWMTVSGNDADFPILLLTARRVNSPEREEFVSTWSRADSVVYKPFPLQDLVLEIEGLLGAEASV